MTNLLKNLTLATLLISSCGSSSDRRASQSHTASVGEPSTASDMKLVQFCSSEAIKSLKLKAAPCVVNAETLKASYIDNRWYNPSAYIWYEAAATCADQEKTTVKTMIQYYNERCY